MINHHHFYVITIHYIKNFNLFERILDLIVINEKSVTAEILKQQTEQILEKYNILDKIVSSTCDGGTNIKLAFQSITDKLHNFHCIAHSMNLITKKSLKIIYIF